MQKEVGWKNYYFMLNGGWTKVKVTDLHGDMYVKIFKFCMGKQAWRIWQSVEGIAYQA